MATRQRKRSWLSGYILPTLATAFLTYFGFHAIHGQQGWIAHSTVEKRIVERSKTLEELRTDRKKLELRTQLLSASSLDRETIDEFARAKLNLANENEVVILLKITK